MNYNETYEEWAESAGILKDEESFEAWEHQQMKIDVLRKLIKLLQPENK